MSTPALLQTYSSPPSLLCPRSQQLQELSGLHDIQEALILQRHIYCVSIAIDSNVLTCDTQTLSQSKRHNAAPTFMMPGCMSSTNSMAFSTWPEFISFLTA